MRLSPDIKIYPFAEAPGYLLMFSDKRGIVTLLHDSYYCSMKNGNIAAFDENWLLMNELISADRNKPFRDVLVDELPDISIAQELERIKKRWKQFLREEYQTPDIGELTERIDGVIIKHFHDRFRKIGPPSKEKMIISYRNIDRIVNAYVYRKRPGRKRGFVKEAYFAAAAIRHVDDFIDKVLWPDLSSFDPKELSELFCIFLNDWLVTVREFDPELPDEMIELCLIEMDLTLHCSQENFEQNFEKLFKRKSFDVIYLHQKIHNNASKPISPGFLLRLGLIDYIRDFYKESIERDTDLSFYKYIRDNKLDPGKLIDFLIRLYEREDPVGSKIAKSYLVSQNIPVVVEKQRAGIPVFSPFPKVFARAITLLNQLPKNS